MRIGNKQIIKYRFGESDIGTIIFGGKQLAFTSNGDGTCYVSGIGTITSTDVIIPSVSPDGDTVTGIGTSAFRESGLTSITIPDSVTRIENQAFQYCAALTSVTIGNGVTFIGLSAFNGCTALDRVYITDLAKWCNIVFRYEDANPLNLAHNLYLNGELITDLVIPNSVTRISSRAFLHCTSLTSVTIGNRVTTIGERSFFNCTALTSVTIGDSVTRIEKESFYGCSSLTSITIPDSVTFIGNSAFSHCASLTSAYILATTPPTLENASVFHESNNNIYVPYSSDHSILNAYQTATYWSTYASRIYELPTLAFTSNGDGTCYVSGIGTITSTDVIIPSVSPDGDTVVGISNDAFQNNQNIVSVTIPNSVEYIAGSGTMGGAFESCYSLETVIIGSAVMEIGQEVFNNCTALTSVTIHATTPPTLASDNAFENTNLCPIYVPAASVNAYKAATSWSALANRIFAIQ